MEEQTLRSERVNEDIELFQSKKGLTYGSDAYLLFAYLKRFPAKAKGAELGCGSGIISLLAAAKGKLSHITAYEVQSLHAKIASKNVKANGFEDKIEVSTADIRQVNDKNGYFDAVFTNPPYMKAKSGKRNAEDEKYLARHEVTGDIGDFCAAASRMLKYGGYFYAVYRPDRAADLIAAMRENRLEPKRMTLVYPDAKSRPCILLAEGKKGASSGIFFTMPLIMHRDAGASPLEDTPELEYIYENGEFDERYRKA